MTIVHDIDIRVVPGDSPFPFEVFVRGTSVAMVENYSMGMDVGIEILEDDTCGTVLRNRTMAAALDLGEAKDVSPYREEGRDTYLLPPNFYEDDIDYCDAKLEAWVWSIGRMTNGEVRAALDGRYYQNAAGYSCLWLR